MIVYYFFCLLLAYFSIIGYTRYMTRKQKRRIKGRIKTFGAVIYLGIVISFALWFFASLLYYPEPELYYESQQERNYYDLARFLFDLERVGGE